MKLFKFVACVFAICVQIANSAVIQEDGLLEDDANFKAPSRYVIGEDSVRRIQAKQRCNNDGGQLAAIHVKKDLDELKARLATEPNGNVFWIGGLYRDNSNCKGQPFRLDCWYWDETNKFDQFYDPSLISFDEEAQTGKPPRSSAMLLKGGDDLLLDYDGGAELHPYICDREPSSRPPCDCEDTIKEKKSNRISQPLNDRYLVSMDSVRRNEAQLRCTSKGGRLANIQIEKDVIDLQNTLVFRHFVQAFWIGGLYKDNDNCKGQTFQVDCWYWDEEDDYKKYYNSSLIRFTDLAQIGNPPRTSAMTLLSGNVLKLHYDAGAEIHRYICDFEPSSPLPIICPCSSDLPQKSIKN